MAGTIPLSLTQQFDEYGEPLSGGKLYLIQAGTVATPQNGYQDVDLTIALPNPVILDAAGRIPQFFLEDGYIKARLQSADGVVQLSADYILVIGPSSGSGGGGGGTVDETTILATGDIKYRYGTGALDGFVRCNGRSIGTAISGATERPNADCEALFLYLWAADANLAVSGGRGASASADWLANKTIALPDGRGRALAGLDGMGSSAASNLTTTYFGSDPTVLGAKSSNQSATLATANLPAYTPSGSVSLSLTGTAPMAAHGYNVSNGIVNLESPTGTAENPAGTSPITFTGSSASFNGSAQGGSSTPFGVIQPTMVITIYIKL